MMARFTIGVVAFLALLAGAMAQPEIFDITGLDSFNLTMEPSSYGATLVANLTLLYTSIDVPFNAWWVAVNISTPQCLDYSYDPPIVAPRNKDLEMIVQRYLPCNYYTTQYLVNTSNQPGMICYYESYAGANKLNWQYDDWFYYPWLTQGMVSTPDLTNSAIYGSTSDYNVGVYAFGYPVTPGKNYMGVGRRYTGIDNLSCNVTYSTQILTAPAGQLVANMTGVEPTFVDYQNVSLTTGNTTVHAVNVTAQSTIYRIPNIPVGTTYLAVNITLPSSYPFLATGASFPITNKPASSDYECSSDDGYAVTVNGYVVYEIICFSPRWNNSYYINVDLGAGYVDVIAATFTAVTCPTGWTGTSCTDPLYKFNLAGPAMQNFTGYTESGAVHVYFDTPAYNWNTSVILAIDYNSSNSGNYIYLRENSYSSGVTSVYGIYPYSTSSSFSNRNPFDASWSYASASYGMASTPYERYATHTNRWVFSYICGSGLPCDYELSVGIASVAEPIPEPITPPSPPVAPVAPTAPSSGAPGTPSSGTPSSGTPSGGAPNSAAVLAPLSALVIALVALVFF